MRLFFLMAIVTAIEVVLISKVGTMIGFWPTFFIIIGTAWLGSRMLGKQWRDVVGKMQSLQGNPSDSMLEALVLIICGVLLVTPGFLTDIIGFLGLIPKTREHLTAMIRKYAKTKGNFTMQTSHFESQQQSRYRSDDVIDGEFERKDD